MLGMLARRSTSRLLPVATAAVSAFLTVMPAAAARSADAQTTPQRVNPNAKAIAEFQEEINEYVELHRTLEKTLTPVPRDATPEMIDKYQRDLGRLIQQARKNQPARRRNPRSRCPIVKARSNSRCSAISVPANGRSISSASRWPRFRSDSPSSS